MRSLNLLGLSDALLALPSAANNGPVQDSDPTTTGLPADVAPSAVIVRPSDVPSDLKDVHAEGNVYKKLSCTYDGCVCVSAAVATSPAMGFLSPVLDFLPPVLSLKSLILPAVGLLSALFFYD